MTKKRLGKTIKILNNPSYFLIIFLGLSLVIFLWFIFSQVNKKTIKDFENSQVKIQDKDKTLLVNKDGSIIFKNPTTSVQQTWDEEKIRILLSTLKDEAENIDEAEQAALAFKENYQVTLSDERGFNFSFKIGKDNQIINNLFNFFNNSSDGESIDSNWFDRVFPSGNTSSGGTGGGSSGGTSSGGGRPSDCPLWILSMCIYPRHWSFSPAPSASSPSLSPSVFLPKPTKSPAVPDCSLWEQLVTGRTVISNTLCVKEQK